MLNALRSFLSAISPFLFGASATEASGKPSGIIGRLTARENGYIYVDEGITNANFPTSAEPSLEGAELEELDAVTPLDVILGSCTLSRRRGATAAETLHYGAKNPLELLNGPIAGIGQTFVDDDGDELAVVVAADPNQEGRVALLEACPRGWPAGYRFLTFPM